MYDESPRSRTPPVPTQGSGKRLSLQLVPQNNQSNNQLEKRHTLTGRIGSDKDLLENDKKVKVKKLHIPDKDLDISEDSADEEPTKDIPVPSYESDTSINFEPTLLELEEKLGEYTDNDLSVDEAEDSKPVNTDSNAPQPDEKKIGQIQAPHFNEYTVSPTSPTFLFGSSSSSRSSGELNSSTQNARITSPDFRELGLGASCSEKQDVVVTVTEYSTVNPRVNPTFSSSLPSASVTSRSRRLSPSTNDSRPIADTPTATAATRPSFQYHHSSSMENRENTIVTLTYDDKTKEPEDYQVKQQIGRGGFGTVYAAIHIKTKKEYAMKIMCKKKIAEKKMSDRVNKEIDIHYRLEHPHIVKLYNFFEDNENVYLVLEYCQNGEFRNLLKERGCLTEHDARFYMKHVLDGMLYLHKHKIMHRDLSLANLLLTKDMVLKIADFGLASQVKQGEPHVTMCGTPNFIPPEIASQEQHGLGVDIWSVGCMLYNMLVGQPPFDAGEGGAYHTLDNVKKGVFTMPDHLSSEARDLICSLLRKDPEERLSLEGIKHHPFMTKKDVFNQPSPTGQKQFNGASIDSGRGTYHSSASSQPSAASSQAPPISNRMFPPKSRQNKTGSQVRPKSAGYNKHLPPTKQALRTHNNMQGGAATQNGGTESRPKSAGHQTFNSTASLGSQGYQTMSSNGGGSTMSHEQQQQQAYVPPASTASSVGTPMKQRHATPRRPSPAAAMRVPASPPVRLRDVDEAEARRKDQRRHRNHLLQKQPQGFGAAQPAQQAQQAQQFTTTQQRQFNESQQRQQFNMTAPSFPHHTNSVQSPPPPPPQDSQTIIDQTQNNGFNTFSQQQQHHHQQAQQHHVVTSHHNGNVHGQPNPYNNHSYSTSGSQPNMHHHPHYHQSQGRVPHDLSASMPVPLSSVMQQQQPQPQQKSYNAQIYQSNSIHDQVAPSVHEQFSRNADAARSRDGSPISLSSSGSSQPMLNLTVASKGSQDSNETRERIQTAIQDQSIDATLESDLCRSLTPSSVGNMVRHQGDRGVTTLRQLKRQQLHKSSTDLESGVERGQNPMQNAMQRSPLKSKSMEYLNQHMVDIDIGEGGATGGHPPRLQRQKSHDDVLQSTSTNTSPPRRKTSKDRPPPLIASRLRPIRQRTKNAIVNILPNNEVCLEFIKQKAGAKSGEQRIVEVIRISQDGMKIYAYAPTKSDIGDEPPPVQNLEQLKVFDYDSLPSKYLRKYQYATRFVNLLRSKTPKVTLYTSQAKCMLMENSPKADFEVIFYDGAKFSQASDSIRIIEKDGTAITLESSVSFQRLAPETQALLKYVKQCNQDCLSIEQVLGRLEESARRTNGLEENFRRSKEDVVQYFPVTIGRRPNNVESSTPTTPDIESTPKATTAAFSNPPTAVYQNSNNNSPGTMIASPLNMRSFDGTVCSRATSTYPSPQSQQPSPLNQSQQQQHTPQTPHHGRQQAQAFPLALPPRGKAPRRRMEFRVNVPGVGIAQQMSDGDIIVNFFDGRELTLITSQEQCCIIFKDTDGHTASYRDKDKTPQHVTDLLNQHWDAIIETLKKASNR